MVLYVCVLLLCVDIVFCADGRKFDFDYSDEKGGSYLNNSIVRAAAARVVEQRKRAAGVKRARVEDGEESVEDDAQEAPKRRSRRDDISLIDDELHVEESSEKKLQKFIKDNEVLARQRTFDQTPGIVSKYPGAQFIERFLKLIDRNFGTAKGAADQLEKIFPKEYEQYRLYRQEVFKSYKEREAKRESTHPINCLERERRADFARARDEARVQRVKADPVKYAAFLARRAEANKKYRERKKAGLVAGKKRERE